MPAPTFSIQPASGDADLRVVKELFQAYAAELDIDFCLQGFQEEIATLPGKYSAPTGELFLARSAQDEPAGCVAIRPLTEGACELKRLYVAPRFRRARLGRDLLEAALQSAASLDYREICLDTLPTLTAAVALYQSAGFAEIPPYNDAPIKGTIFFGRRLRSES